ncbi:MAG: serine/threonine protein kinase [Candidatus Parabeggiatoa sp.]|nr:serine/threonine protein kinase [Candidatus Parabeggiatoa sp.]
MNNIVEHCNALPIDFQLENYKIQSILGEGSFGITYLAKETQNNTLVAIKEYLPNELAIRDNNNYIVQPKSQTEADDFVWGLKRFVEEAQILAQFKHINIIRVLRFFQAFNTAYLVMEYEFGRNLARFLNEGKTMTEDELISFVAALLEGLETIHQAGCLHQDIKPANIYIRDEDNNPVLIDFGAARYELGCRSRRMTTMISIGYTPYEQCDGSQQGAWTDIYSLGAVLYRLISGQVPPEATERVAALIMHNQSDALKPAVKVGEGRYSHPFLEAIDWALKLNEQERPQTVKALRDKLLFKPSLKLEELSMPSVGTDETKSPPVAAHSSWLRPFATGVGVTLLLAILVGGSFLFYQEREARLQAEAAVENARHERDNAPVLAGFDNTGMSPQVAQEQGAIPAKPQPDELKGENTKLESEPMLKNVAPKPSPTADQQGQLEHQARQKAQAAAAAAKAQLPSGRLRIMSAAGVRLRQQPRHRAPKGVILQIGTIVSELEMTLQEEEQWYRVQSPENDEQGWVYGGYTLPLEPDKRGEAYIQVAENKLKSRQASFGDLVDLCHFINRAHSEVELESAVELKWLYLLALQQSLDKIQPHQQDDPRYVKWISQSEADIVYKESKGGWVVKKERFQQLHDQYRFLPIAKRILREAP